MPEDTTSAPLEHLGLRYHTHPEVYEPHDDTWLLVELVQRLPLKGRRVIEVGCGAGLAMIAAAQRGAHCIGIDRNPHAVRLMLQNAGENQVRGRVQGLVGDLLSPIATGSTDLVLFNPPYLPEDPVERVEGPLRYALEDGPTGDETIDRFLTQLENEHAQGRSTPDVAIVLSNHNDDAMIRRRLEALGLDRHERSTEKRYFFHWLWVEHHTRVADP